MANELKEAITKEGLHYKEVAYRLGYSTGQVCADVSRGRLSVEKAIRYGRVLNVDPSLLRPDIFRPGEVVYNGRDK
jgi:hypothetical protein